MKLFLAALCTLLTLSAKTLTLSQISTASDITEDWLIQAGRNTGYTDHISHFKRLFAKTKVKTFMEFGLGFSTKYFLDNAENVLSVEFVAPGSDTSWLSSCMKLYQGCTNWNPIIYLNGEYQNFGCTIYRGIDSVHKACVYQRETLQHYALIDPSYLKDLARFVDTQLATNQIDVAFVDPGVYIRSDLVQILFNKVPIIFAHDIAASSNRPNVYDLYGYNRIVVPENYTEIHFPYGCGTACWIKNDPQNQALILDLIEYSKNL